MKSIIIIAAVLLVATNAQGMNIWRKIQGYGCTNEKIEIKDKIGQCKCQDGSQCLWTDEKPIMGCPCTVTPKANNKPDCLRLAQKFGCSPTKFECSANFGQCTCPDQSSCAWAKETPIMGCPCGSNTPPPTMKKPKKSNEHIVIEDL